MKKNKNNILKIDSLKKSSAPASILNMANRIEELKTENKIVSEMAARSILKALNAKDHYTYGHCMRVCYFSMVVGKELNLDEDELYELQMAGLFHDIGKIGTPDAILNKPSQLNEEEFSIMREHPVMSYNILKEFFNFEKIALSAKHHHERFDGRGYPDRLKGEEIPLFARIILIADTFDAMTSTRVYRKGLPYEVAFEELIEFSGTQFDPGLVKHFIKGMKKEQLKNEDKFYIPLMDEAYKKDAA